MKTAEKKERNETCRNRNHWNEKIKDFFNEKWGKKKNDSVKKRKKINT